MRTLTRITMYVIQSRSHGRDLPHILPPSRRPPLSRGLSLRKYHICDSWVSNIAQAIRAAQIGSLDLMILMETKITDQSYCCNRLGHNVVCLKVIMMVDDDIHTGVGMIIRDRPQVWSIESTRFHGTNVVRCKVFTRKRTPIVISYLLLELLIQG